MKKLLTTFLLAATAYAATPTTDAAPAWSKTKLLNEVELHQATLKSIEVIQENAQLWRGTLINIRVDVSEEYFVNLFKADAAARLIVSNNPQINRIFNTKY